MIWSNSLSPFLHKDKVQRYLSRNKDHKCIYLVSWWTTASLHRSWIENWIENMHCKSLVSMLVAERIRWLIILNKKSEKVNTFKLRIIDNTKAHVFICMPGNSKYIPQSLNALAISQCRHNWKRITDKHTSDWLIKT